MKENKYLRDYPEALKDWDYELNSNVLTPEYLPSRSNKQYYWKCNKGHPSYLCSVDHKTIRHFGCPVCSNHKIIPGINDFESNNPELMEEWNWDVNNRNNVIPSTLGPVSSHMASWKCKRCGNVWDASISNRVRMHSGCPVCSNQRIVKGVNDLASRKPDLIKEWDYHKNGDLSPFEIGINSTKKVWWICSKGHSWQTSPVHRRKNGCPYCSNHKVLIGYNDFASTCPDAAKEWDYDKNEGKLPTQYTKGSETRAWFKCDKGHSWKVRIAERGKGHKCPYCSNQRVLTGYNDLETTNPELIKEWDYEKNSSISPKLITSGSMKRVWWLCKKCGYSWKASIGSRAKGTGCPVCGAKRTTINRLKNNAAKNGLFLKNPNLAIEWDYVKNIGIDLSLISSASNRFAWWICAKGHSFRTRISSRTLKNVGCPYCAHQILLPGENDLETQNPELAKEWDYDKNKPLTPKEVFSHTNKSFWWKCPICGHSWKARINNRANGRGCPNCSQAGTSFIEQAIFYYIKKSFPDALNRYKYQNTEFDIYIPSLCLAIEYDGVFYHNSKDASIRENKKDQFCIDKNIKLIRLREKPLPASANAINIECDCSKWDRIERTIENLLNYLEIKPDYKISLKKDLTNIITSKRKLMKDRAFGKEFPELLDEWDYEKNLPIIPDYFSKGSDVKVWWICKNGHSFQQKIANRCHGSGCPECFKAKRKEGLNRKK